MKECEEVRESEHALVGNEIFKSMGCFKNSQQKDLWGGVIMIQIDIKIRL